ncbi:MAG: PKD domain-containing protein [Chitinophagaceae bacterium]
MKSTSFLLKSILTVFASLFILNTTRAQNAMPVCSGSGAGLIEVVDTLGNLYKIDPTSPNTFIPTGITLPANSKALAVSANLNGSLVSPTYYTTFKISGINYLHYWNKFAWINTTHICNVDDITGAGTFIYGYDYVNGFIYKYDGTGNAAFILGITPCNNASQDLAGDCAGNFYIINQGATPATLRKYNSSGVLQNTWTLTGTFANGGQGLALNGNTVYYDGSDGKFYSGVIGATTVNFSAAAGTPFKTTPITDMGSCGFNGVGTTVGGLDTVFGCDGTAASTLTATGPGPYNWTVISGPAVITGTGQTVSVTASQVSVVTHKGADCSGNNTLVDTTVLYVANAFVDAGNDTTLIGCHGIFLDTLKGTLIVDTNYHVTYNVQWGPLDGTILSGDRTMNPIIAPTKSQYYYLTISTLAGCTFVDSVLITVVDSTPIPNFAALPKFSCLVDTVRFVNLTRGSFDSLYWEFGDAAGSGSNAISPTFYYTDQGLYQVKLLTYRFINAGNDVCIDSVEAVVNLLHPNIPEFGVSDSMVCAGTPITFKDKSKTYTCPPNELPMFEYDFGDGTTSTQSNIVHTYTKTGSYKATLVLRNCLGCVDSFSKIIVVDTLPFVRFKNPDTVICEGQAVHLIADYLKVGNTGTTIDLGDGTVFQNRDTVVYSFANAGTYNVTITGHYRICPDLPDTQIIRVDPYPRVYLGEDTVLCPNGSPIVLSDRNNSNNPDAKFLWNTGAHTPSILAKDIGTYWAAVTLGGCTGTDSLVVNKDCYVDIPNSFTPNGDGINDYFLPRQLLGRSINSFTMTVFNRWGQIVFQSSTTNGRGWDGKFNNEDQPTGVYVYVIDVSFDNNVSEHYTGNVTLLR